LADEIRADGGQAIYAVADVTDQSALQAASDKAAAEFGGYDTWVNNAGGSIYGRIMDVPVEDFRRLFETNLWGVVNGSKIAVEHLRRKAGGALINIGSEVSDAPLPLQRASMPLRNMPSKALLTVCEWNWKPTVFRSR
jgi:NAD(P)-dependent dehydrogenase (short-subunit alcohol dehydrogenase family)